MRCERVLSSPIFTGEMLLPTVSFLPSLMAVALSMQALTGSLLRRRNWCTLCMLALRHRSQAAPIFQTCYGASLVAISGQLAPHNRACESSSNLDFRIEAALENLVTDSPTAANGS